MSELSIATKGIVIFGRILALAIIWATFIISFFHGVPSNIAVSIFLCIALLGIICTFTPLRSIGLKKYAVLYALLLISTGILFLVI